MFEDPPQPPLHLPEIAPPPGARIDHGQVACFVCARIIPLASADIVGQGYRCATCSQRAEFARLGGSADDPSLHLDAGDAKRLAASGARASLVGLAMVVGGLGLAWWHPFDVGIGSGLALAATGVGAIINGERQSRLAAAAGGARRR